MKLGLKIAEVSLTALLIVAIGFVASWSLLPRLVGLDPEVVLSGSMEPALKTGGVVIVQPKKASEINIGDILTYHHPERPRSARILVTHRVTAVEMSSGAPVFTTKGDANDIEDPWKVPSSDVVGTVKWHVPYMGYVAERVRTPLGFALLLGIPALILASGEVRNIVKQIRTRNPSAQVEDSNP